MSSTVLVVGRYVQALERAWRSTRRIAIALLEQYRTPETLARRIDKMVERLAENSPRRATKL